MNSELSVVEEPVVARLRRQRLRRDLIALDELVGAVDHPVAVQIVQHERAGLGAYVPLASRRDLVEAFLARDAGSRQRTRSCRYRSSPVGDDEPGLGRRRSHSTAWSPLDVRRNCRTRIWDRRHVPPSDTTDRLPPRAANQKRGLIESLRLGNCPQTVPESMSRFDQIADFRLHQCASYAPYQLLDVVLARLARVPR